MSTETKRIDLDESFDRLSKVVLRCKSERDKLLAAAAFALKELDEHYDVDQVGECRRELPFRGAGEVMRRLRYAIDFAEERGGGLP